MIRVAHIPLILSCLVVASCASTSPVTHSKEGETVQTITQREMLIGIWRGEAPVKSGGSRFWVVQRHPDGTYQIDFTLINASGAKSSHSEIGIWGTSAGIYFTATRGYVEGSGIDPADTTDPTLYDAYRIIDLTYDKFEYQNLSTGNRFVVKRVMPSASAP